MSTVVQLPDAHRISTMFSVHFLLLTRLSQPRKRLKKRASAPNPLSCKKAKLVKDSGGAGAKSAAGAAAARDGRKRLRRKKKSLAAGSDGGGGGGGGSVGGGSVAGAGERLGVSGADV